MSDANKTETTAPAVRVLFLDVDGVLCTDGETLNVIAELQVHRIAKETGCEIVLTSSWRKSPSRLTRLRKAGFPFSGVTPDFSTAKDAHGSIHREAEILAWLECHSVDQFAILDDCEETLKGLRSNLFRTQFRIGLTAGIADAVIAFLNVRSQEPT